MFTHGLRIVYAWFTHGLRKVYAGLRNLYAWFTHGLRIVYARFRHGLRKQLMFTHVYSIVSKDLSMIRMFTLFLGILT
jgi:hypothetical protein